MRPSRAVATIAAIAVMPAWATSAQAFNCYIGGPEDAVVTVHQRPDARAPIVARLTWSAMVSDGRRPRERDGWIRVRWSIAQRSQRDFDRGHHDGTGWVRRSAIQGECED